MSKSIGVQLTGTDKELQSVLGSDSLTPAEFRAELSSISSSDSIHSSQTPSRLTPFRKHVIKANLRSLPQQPRLNRTTSQTRKVTLGEKRPLIITPNTDLHSLDVSLKPVSALHRIRTVTALFERKKDDFVENFWQGRSVLNRLMLESVKERQKIETLTALRLRAEEQRSQSQLQAMLRKKQRQEVADEAADRRKLVRSASELDIKQHTLQTLQTRGALREAMRAKRVPPQTTLAVHSMNLSLLPPRLPPPPLHVYFSSNKTRPFRFK